MFNADNIADNIDIIDKQKEIRRLATEYHDLEPLLVWKDSNKKLERKINDLEKDRKYDIGLGNSDEGMFRILVDETIVVTEYMRDWPKDKDAIFDEYFFKGIKGYAIGYDYKEQPFASDFPEILPDLPRPLFTQQICLPEQKKLVVVINKNERKKAWKMFSSFASLRRLYYPFLQRRWDWE